MSDRETALLRDGRLRVHGRLTGASNAVLYGSVAGPGGTLPCVYKPVAGERPLWDFPDGTLAHREVAAYEVCQALGWDLVPTTVLRDGPHGLGMCQRWIGPAPRGADPDDGAAHPAATSDPGGQPATPAEAPIDEALAEEPAVAAEEPAVAAADLLALVDRTDPEPGWKAVGRALVGPDRTALLVHADDARLRRLAVLDAVINNADRKGGHLLLTPDGRLYAIDHGVSFHVDNKLRTLLWGWAGEKLPEDALEAVRDLSRQLADGEPLVTRLAALLGPAELAALRDRAAALVHGACHPPPSGDGPAIPWPLV